MLGLVDTLRLKADNSVKLKAIAHSTPSELGTLWVAARRLHLRLFIFNPFGILGKLFISHSLFIKQSRHCQRLMHQRLSVCVLNQAIRGDKR